MSEKCSVYLLLNRRLSNTLRGSGDIVIAGGDMQHNAVRSTRINIHVRRHESLQNRSAVTHDLVLLLPVADCQPRRSFVGSLH